MSERRGKPRKRRARSKLIYLPFIQRLQRLYARPREVDFEAFQQEFFQPPPIVEATQVGVFLQDLSGGEIQVQETLNDLEEDEWISDEDTEEEEVYVEDDYESE
ncbi:unnamed protein product [Cuscuta campestris]|uniref:Uncharacterized protein n=1 Tax=Cuscuta campestris TaxID=132261 RepID=A0A484N6T4_9ASTE|nr:unnamed protein product [Cuscuta campestris]